MRIRDTHSFRTHHLLIHGGLSRFVMGELVGGVHVEENTKYASRSGMLDVFDHIGALRYRDEVREVQGRI